MDFDFNEDQYLFQETFKNFLTKEFPLEKYISDTESGNRGNDLWSQLADLGLFSLLVPEEYGGLGMGLVDLTLILEELGKGLVPPPVAETLIATDMIVRFGSTEQKSRYLPKISEGNLKFVQAFLEKESGYDPAEIQATLLPQRGGSSLNGQKIMVPQVDITDFILVAVKTDSGLAVAIVGKDHQGVGSREHNTLDDASHFHEVMFDNVILNDNDILKGDGIVDRMFDICSAVYAIQLIGIAGKVMDISVDFASQRVQFDKPIGSFQAIKHKCADMAVGIDGGRSAAYYGMWAIAEDSADSRQAVSMAKVFCGDTARSVCNEGIQIHGGMGFTWELGLHYYLRRTKVLEYISGDSSYHRERVITETLKNLQIV